MNKHVRIQGSLLAHNTVVNFVGQVVPIIIGIATIPFIIRGLGTDSFGILALAWMVVGYFSLFNLGLGRATTKFVAETLGKGEAERLPCLIWTSLGLHLLLGLMGGLLLAILTPPLVERVSVRIPSSSLTFLLPAIGLPLGFGLPGIVLFLIVARLGTASAYLILCLKVFPSLKKGFSFHLKAMRPLVMFGGWITVSNGVGPVLAYLDRFLIGSLPSMAPVCKEDGVQ